MHTLHGCPRRTGLYIWRGGLGFEMHTLHGCPRRTGLYIWRGGRDSKCTPSTGARGGLGCTSGGEVDLKCTPSTGARGGLGCTSGGEGGIRNAHPPRVPAADWAVHLAGRAGFEMHTLHGCPRRTGLYIWRGRADSQCTPSTGARGGLGCTSGGEGGIRTHGGGFSPRTHLAGEPNRPLWHLPVGGGRGIRTHDGFLHTCFQDRRLKPLGHPSRVREPAKYTGQEIPLKRTEFYHIHREDATF